jgi:hypothetical protein
MLFGEMTSRIASFFRQRPLGGWALLIWLSTGQHGSSRLHVNGPRGRTCSSRQALDRSDFNLITRSKATHEIFTVGIQPTLAVARRIRKVNPPVAGPLACLNSTARAPAFGFEGAPLRNPNHAHHTAPCSPRFPPSNSSNCLQPLLS